MKPLTQYGRLAEKHWREFLPRMVRELERKGLLHPMLLEAEERTKDEMATLRTRLMQQGSTAHQAQTQAWELVREKYLLLPPESWQTATRPSADGRAGPRNRRAT